MDATETGAEYGFVKHAFAVALNPEGGGSEITPTIGSVALASIASRNDRGIFVPTEVDV